VFGAKRTKPTTHSCTRFLASRARSDMLCDQQPAKRVLRIFHNNVIFKNKVEQHHKCTWAIFISTTRRIGSMVVEEHVSTKMGFSFFCVWSTSKPFLFSENPWYTFAYFSFMLSTYAVNSLTFLCKTSPLMYYYNFTFQWFRLFSKTTHSFCLAYGEVVVFYISLKPRSFIFFFNTY